MINKSYKFMSQEALKAIACGIMLLDHVGVLLHSHWMRLVGRIAFPIFCFLIAEGAFHTKNPKKYGLRLLIFAVLSEISYDLFVGTGWQNQNVMFTLLLGFAAIRFVKFPSNKLLKVVSVVACAMLADIARSDYGGCGVLLIVAFSASRNFAYFRYWLPGVFAFGLEHHPTAVLSLAPIACYNGRKLSDHKWTKWGFYLFYPAHLLALAFIKRFV